MSYAFSLVVCDPLGSSTAASGVKGALSEYKRKCGIRRELDLKCTGYIYIPGVLHTVEDEDEVNKAHHAYTELSDMLYHQLRRQPMRRKVQRYVDYVQS